MVGAVVFQELPLVSGGGKLTFGQAIDAVVLDDIGEGHIAADDMLELTHADRAAVPVSTDGNTLEIRIRQQRAGHHRGHAAVQSVEAV